jgi:hypothetical protein
MMISPILDKEVNESPDYSQVSDSELIHIINNIIFSVSTDEVRRECLNALLEHRTQIHKEMLEKEQYQQFLEQSAVTIRDYIIASIITDFTEQIVFDVIVEEINIRKTTDILFNSVIDEEVKWILFKNQHSYHNLKSNFRKWYGKTIEKCQKRENALKTLEKRIEKKQNALVDWWINTKDIVFGNQKQPSYMDITPIRDHAIYVEKTITNVNFFLNYISIY